MNGTELSTMRVMKDGMDIVPAGPVELYRQATDVAGVCRDIVRKTAKRIGNRNHVAVEGWQAIATTHGCILSIDEVREDEEGNVYSIASVRRMSDGVTLSKAEGFVGMDEKTWATRARYARRAMAQTRAMSRVARAAFAHVVILIDAGLSTTPAEEMGSEDGAYDHAPATRQTQTGFILDWRKAITDQGFTQDGADWLLDLLLTKRGKTLEQIPADARAKLLEMAKTGHYDAWLRPPAKEPTNVTDTGRAVLDAPSTEDAGGNPAQPAPDSAEPPVDVIAEAMAQDEYPMTLVEKLKQKAGVTADLAMKAVNGFVKLNGAGGDASGVPQDKRVNLFKSIEAGTAHVSKTGVLRWE